MATQRIYRVKYEGFEDGRWMSNYVARDVAVVGGAEQAIKVANQREKRDREAGFPRTRVEEVTLLASED